MVEAEYLSIRLADPPEPVQVGLGVHGVTRARDVFRLPDLWQLHLYQYEGTLSLGERVHRIRPGRVSLIPPGATAEFTYQGRSEHLYAHFRTGGGTETPIPVMRDAGTAHPLLRGLLVEAVRHRDRPAATAALWTALWRIVDLGAETDEPAGPAALRAAMDHIEWHLAEPLSVPDLAATVGVSHNHLTRLFRAATGLSVVGYLRDRRMRRARHLLTETTVPIATVAATVGIPDPQAFNKTCRRELGAAPSAIRAASR